MLGELRDSLDARGLTFDWDGSLVDYLVKKSYSVQYGARNLRRTIQKDLDHPIAEKLIDAYQNPLHALHAKADGEHCLLYTSHSECGELGLPVKDSGLVLPGGSTGRWTGK